MKSLLSALQFLTVFPFPPGMFFGEKALGKSVPYFPFVGLLIGGIMMALDLGLRHVFPVGFCSVAVVIAMLFASGGLHIDGLADTADGFMSSRPKERVLEIMKDSRTGPMGVVAIVCVILLKAAALASVTFTGRWWVILMMPLAGRCSLIVNMAVLPYAKEGGLGSIFHQYRSWLHIVWALLLLAGIGWAFGRSIGVAAGVASFVASLIWAWHTYRKIGGLTGDTLGAGCELAEIVPALVAAAMIH